MAEMPDCSSLTRRTVEVVAETSMIWPMTPPELHTGMPTSKPAFTPLSMMTALDQASPVDPIMRAAVDFRLYVDWSPTSFSRRAAVS